MDKEEVIKDLEEYRDREFVKEGITIFDADPRYRKLIINNALAMLKNQKEEIENLKQTCQSMMEGAYLLKGQEAVEWIDVKDRLPKKDGQYLVVYKYFDYRSIGVVRFATNLYKVDKYIFDTEKRPGWYEPDDEVGYFERTGVTHWAKLPEFPKEGR